MHGHIHSMSVLHRVFSNTLQALETSPPVFHVRRSFDPVVLVAVFFCAQFSTGLLETNLLVPSKILWEPWRLVKVKTRGGEARVLRTARYPHYTLGVTNWPSPTVTGKSAKCIYFCQIDGDWCQCISDSPDSRAVLASTEATHLLKWNVEFWAHVGSILGALQPHGQQPPYRIPEIWDIDIMVGGSAGHINISILERSDASCCCD